VDTAIHGSMEVPFSFPTEAPTTKVVSSMDPNEEAGEKTNCRYGNGHETRPLTTARKESRSANRIKRKDLQANQDLSTSYWSTHAVETAAQPAERILPSPRRGQMCPSGEALNHPAAPLLSEYATKGCPVKTGSNWTLEQLEAAVEKGPHSSALIPEAIKQHTEELHIKVQKGQAKVVLWDELKQNLPPELKISPFAMVPHKSKPFRGILDLSFILKLQEYDLLSVNDRTTRQAPPEALDQLGHELARIIVAVAEADESESIFFAKWDIKDGFWRMVCREGAEYNFAYVMPQPPGEPVRIVIPTSLQMGWVESPGYFCTASETARDVAEKYVRTPVGSNGSHKFLHHTQTGSYSDVNATIPGDLGSNPFKYMLGVFVDDFISLVIPRCQTDLDHVAASILHGIHDVFPPDADDNEDPISLKKLLRGEGAWDLRKEILGWIFDGKAKTIELAPAKVAERLALLDDCLSKARRGEAIPMNSFQKLVGKLRDTALGIPGGLGLMSPLNAALSCTTKFINIGKDSPLFYYLSDWKYLIKAATQAPTKCKELVAVDTPGYVGMVDSAKGGVGGVVFGHRKKCLPHVFRFEWPREIQEAFDNGIIDISDLEMAGLLILWIVMEGCIGPDELKHEHVCLLSDNSPSVSWLERMSSRKSVVAGRLLRALSIRMRECRASPLTPLHIPGVHNTIADIPSRSFGYKKEWHYEVDTDFLQFFNSQFPLPEQNCWRLFSLHNKVTSKVTSLLLQPHAQMHEWRRLPKLGTSIGGIGSSMENLFNYVLILTRDEQAIQQRSMQLEDSQLECARGIMDTKNKSPWQRYVQLSRPLARRSPWIQDTTHCS